MKTTRSTRSLALMALLAMSGASFANGNHSGGHAHSDEESAIGKPGLTTKAGRTITVEMGDNMRFTPSDIQVKKGETIRIVVRNTGQVKHELSLGTQQELLEHLELMKKFPDMEHDEPNKVTVAPGKQGEILWQFTKSGTVNFACLMPGHYEAGMKGTVQVGKK